MDKKILFAGAVVMIVLGLVFEPRLSAQTAVGLGLLWMGLASIK